MSPDQIQHLLKFLDSLDDNMAAQLRVLKNLTGEIQMIAQQVEAIDLQMNPPTGQRITVRHDFVDGDDGTAKF